MVDAIGERVREIVRAVTGLQGDNPTGWDSLAHLNLVMALQESFGVALSERDMQEMTSSAAVEAVIRRRLGADG